MAVNPIPAGNLSFNVYDTNNNILLGIASIDLPEIEFQAE